MHLSGYSNKFYPNKIHQIRTVCRAINFACLKGYFSLVNIFQEKVVHNRKILLLSTSFSPVNLFQRITQENIATPKE